MKLSLVCLLLIFFVACSKPWLLTDRQGHEFPVKGASLQESPVVLVEDSRRVLDMDEIKELQVDQQDPMVKDGKVFYAVKLWLLEGPPLGTDTAKGKVWMVADQVVAAQAGDGSLQVPLTELRSLKRIEKDEYEKRMLDTLGKGAGK